MKSNNKNMLLLNVRLATTISLLLLSSYGPLEANERLLENAPLWITQPTQNESCVLGIGSFKAADPKQEAINVSKVEHALSKNADIKHKYEFFARKSKEFNDKSIKSTTQIGTKSVDGNMIEKSSWRNQQGDVFILGCVDDSAKSEEQKFEIREFIQEQNKTSHSFSVKIEDQEVLSIEEEYQNATSSPEIYPQWFLKKLISDRAVLTVAKSQIIHNDIRTAYLKAMLSARVNFASSEAAKAKEKNEVYLDGDESHISKKAVEISVEATRLYAMWVDEKNQYLYVAVRQQGSRE